MPQPLISLIDFINFIVDILRALATIMPVPGECSPTPERR